MSRTLKAMFEKAVPIELDRTRKLMFTGRAWLELEKHYGSPAGVLAKGYAQLAVGNQPFTHCVNFLHAFLQEEVYQQNLKRRPKDQETLRYDDVLAMVDISQLQEYRARIIDTVGNYYPDPRKLALKEMNSRGTGGEHTSFSPTNTDGTGNGS